MRLTYRIVAYTISLAVALQAASIALAFSGLAGWVFDGGVLDRAVMTGPGYPGQGGFGFHEVVGMVVIPILGVLLLAFSFFVKVPRAVAWSVIVLVSIVLQIAFAELAKLSYVFGAVHGLFAFAVLAFATVAATRVARAEPLTPAATA
ncbi:hypothetical protein [Microlunatus ginsengisoli]|uniref:DUF998 domain-containing protein n=1 Tax=Microlunatus ginsengisoli TaxID=363863 RepID=A0ABP7A810_9ACTN